MSEAGTTLQRRRHRRGLVAATAIVVIEDRGLIRYFADNLSTGGALLTGGPRLPVGRAMRLVLQIAGEASVDIEAVVIRKSSEGQPGVGVAFSGLRCRDEDLIQGAVSKALEVHERGECPARRILIVDGSRISCEALERDLGCMGHEVTSATKARDAALLVQDPYRPFEVAIIESSVGAGRGEELIRHVARFQPGAHRVLMSTRMTSQLLSDIDGKADAVLPKPWDTKALAAALQPCAGESSEGRVR